MNACLLILTRQVRSRVEAGEDRGTVLASYRLLSDAEKEQVLSKLEEWAATSCSGKAK